MAGGAIVIVLTWLTHLAAYIYGIVRGAQAAGRWNARHGVFAR